MIVDFVGNKIPPVGDLTERLELKQRLKCKDFRWYLDHIYPESSLSNEFVYIGEVSG